MMKTPDNSTIVREIEEGLRINLQNGSSSLALTNSCAAGFSTSKSDVDLILITNETMPASSGSFLTTSVAGKQAEVLVFTPEHFQGEVLRMNSSGTILEGRVSVDYVHRLTQALPIAGNELYERLLKPFDQHEFIVNARKLWFSYVHLSFDDYLGSLEHSDCLISQKFCRRLMQTCMDLLLVSRGDTFDRPKWRLSRVKRTLPNEPELVRDFMERDIGAPTFDERAQLIWTHDTLRFCQHLQLATLRSEFRFPRSSPRTDGEIYHCINPAVVVQLKEKYFIKTADSMYQIDRLASECFLLFSRPSSIADVLTELNRSDPDELIERIDFLERMGLLVKAIVN